MNAQEIKHEIAELATQLLEQIPRMEKELIPGAPQLEATFANEVLAAYHRSEAMNYILLRR